MQISANLHLHGTHLLVTAAGCCAQMQVKKKEASVLLLIKARKRRKYFSTILFTITDRFLDITICCAKCAMQIVMLMHGNIVLVDGCYNLKINRL
jgi:hypothetical protein